MSEARRDAEPVVEPEAGEATEELDADGKRGRRRSKTMSRKEIARELRRQRAFGLIDPELDADDPGDRGVAAAVARRLRERASGRACSSRASTTSTWT